MEEYIGNKEIERDALIGSFLKGQMSEEEEKAFFMEMEKDSEFKFKAVAMARMVRAMDKSGERKDANVKAALGKLERNEVRERLQKVIPVSNKFSSQKRVLYMLPVAASVIFAIAFGFRQYDNYQMSALGEEYLACFPVSEYSRGVEDKVDKEIIGLYRAVESGTVTSSTVDRLMAIYAESKERTYNEYTENSLQIGWILANAYVRCNEKEKAVRILEDIIRRAENGSVLREKADELKEKVENLKILK